MSLDATKWAWSQQIKPTEKLLLLSLADRSGNDNTCFPSIERLNKDTGLNRKTIISNLENLRVKELIEDTGERVGRTRSVKKYKLIGVENMKNGPSSTIKGTAKQYHKRDTIRGEAVPLFPLSSPKNGTGKQSQKRDLESTIKNLPLEPCPEKVGPPFGPFYEKYPVKKSKATASKKWNKLSKADRLSAINGIESYVNSVSDKKYLVYPATYINQRRWEDENTATQSSAVKDYI